MSEAKVRGLTDSRNKSAAFTLAEVLITLAIIGVVAALTLPSLISNYRKQAYVNQLKKVVNTIENGLKLAMADDGVDNLLHTSLWSSLPETAVFDELANTNTSGSEFINELGKYIKIYQFKYDRSEDVYSIKCLNGSGCRSSHGGIYLADGSTIIEGTFFNDNVPIISALVIDVNGEKGPNTVGRDIFAFSLYKDGRLVPDYSKAFVIVNGATEENYKSNSNYWNQNETMKKCNPSSTDNGWGCAARIIEEGWQMDY